MANTLTYVLVAVDPKAVRIKPGTNPRSVNEKAPDFQELLASVEAVGVQQPICVRRDSKGRYELLAGERRLRATLRAGLGVIPALDYGHLDDEKAFEVTFNENFRRKDLKPLEAGRAVSMLMTRYKDDIATVASKVGQTRHWVAEHAQIDRGLSTEWKKEAETNERFADWTAGHWVEIAKLPAALQAKALKWFLGPNAYSCHHWTIERVKQHLADDRLPLAKAPFDTAGCASCPDRTGFQPLLFAESEEAVTGDKDACLHKACYEKKCIRAERAAFKDLATRHNVTDPVPLDCGTAQAWTNPAGFEKRQRAKKVHGKALMCVDNVEVVKRDTPDAVPAIIVCGRGKGSVKWIRKAAADSKTKQGGASTRQRQTDRKAEADRLRYRKLVHQISGELASLPFEEVGSIRALTTGLLLGDGYLPRWEGKAFDDLMAVALSVTTVDAKPDEVQQAFKQIGRMVWSSVAKHLAKDTRADWVGQYQYERLTPVGQLFDRDLKAIYKAEVKAEQKAKTTTKKARPAARTKTGKKPKGKAA